METPQRLSVTYGRIAFAPTEAELETIDLRLFSHFIWLLATPAESLNGERGSDDMAEALASRISDMPVRRSVQRFRWFLSAFEAQIDRTAAETGTTYSTDRSILPEVFADWLKTFQAQKPSNPNDEEAYVGFAVGPMLRKLVQKKPLRAISTPEGADTTHPAYFCPEGHRYVLFCLNLRDLVVERDFDGEQTLGEALDDTHAW